MNHACPHCRTNLRFRYTPMQRDSSGELHQRCPACKEEIVSKEHPHETTLNALTVLFILISGAMIVLLPDIQPRTVALLIGAYVLLLSLIKLRARHCPRYAKAAASSHPGS